MCIWASPKASLGTPSKIIPLRIEKNSRKFPPQKLHWTFRHQLWEILSTNLCFNLNKKNSHFCRSKSVLIYALLNWYESVWKTSPKIFFFEAFVSNSFLPVCLSKSKDQFYADKTVKFYSLEISGNLKINFFTNFLLKCFSEI